MLDVTIKSMVDVSEYKNGWISITERYPVSGQYVLVALNNGTCRVAKHVETSHPKGIWRSHEWNIARDRVVAWHPIPKLEVM